jgi:hypothetical protein
VGKVASLALAITLLIGWSVTPSSAQKATTSYDQAYRDRIARINETIRTRQIRAECKAEAKKAYAAIHFKKRRDYVRDCIARTSR